MRDTSNEQEGNRIDVEGGFSPDHDDNTSEDSATPHPESDRQQYMSHQRDINPISFSGGVEMSSLAFLVTELQVSCISLCIYCKLNEIVFGKRNQEKASRDTRGVCLSSPNIGRRAYDEAVSRRLRDLWLSCGLLLSKRLQI